MEEPKETVRGLAPPAHPRPSEERGDNAAADDPRRIAFGALHGYSVYVLGLAMIAALVALVLMARTLRN